MNLKKASALTLTELLIATILVGIVMLGVTSIDFALRSSHLGTTRNALVAMRTSAMMLRMTKDAQLATGTASDIGIQFTGTKTCFRRDIEPPGTPTPGFFGDDWWVCYDVIGNNLYRCTELTPGAPPGPPCDNATYDTREIIGTVVSFDTAASTLINDTVNRLFYIRLDIVNRFNPAIAASTNDNPEYRLVAHVSPITHSY